jgi:hypothetical protein
MKRSLPPTRRAAPKRSGKPIQRGKRATRRYVTRGGRNSDPEKLAWIRTLCCAVPLYTPWPQSNPGRAVIEAHHHRVRGSRADDAKVIPLCSNHHRDGPTAVHRMGRAAFEKFWGISLDEQCAIYEAAWQAHRAGAAG